MVLPKEFAAAGAIDARIGGFGPWFSGILLLSLGLIIAALRKLWRKNRFLFCLFSGNLLLIFTLLLSLSESWWPRYSPFFYLIPLLGYALSCLRVKRADTGKHGRRFHKFLSIALVCNTLFFAPAALRTLGTALVHMQNIAIRKEPSPAVYFDPGYNYSGVYYNLRDLGLEFTVTAEKPAQGQYYYMLTTQYESAQEDGKLMQWIQALVERFR